jgi:hypothetical protein
VGSAGETIRDNERIAHDRMQMQATEFEPSHSPGGRRVGAAPGQERLRELCMIDRDAARADEERARAAAGPLATRFIAYSDALGRLVEGAKQHDFDSNETWAEIESYFDLPNFVRYGAFQEVTGWEGYRSLLTHWAATTHFWYNFRRLTEAEGRIVWELEEHNTPVGGEENVCHSLTVAQFNPAGRICRLDVYLQSKAMLGAHANWGD